MSSADPAGLRRDLGVWAWYVLIGSAVTFAVGWLVSLAAGPAEASHE